MDHTENLFIDSHAHLTSPQVYHQVEELFQRAKSAGVIAIVNICTDRETLERGLVLSQKHKEIYCTAAIPPHDVEEDNNETFSFISKEAKSGYLVAVGETGLDYYYEKICKKKQITYLEKHLALASECLLPVVFHCRLAFHDLFAICDTHFSEKSAVLHCFTGTREDAKGVLERGWYISFSGIITFKKSTELRQIAKDVPLDRILIETDTPYLAPESKRGRQNEPSYLPEIAETIAKEKGITLQEVAYATSENARRVFSLPKL